MKKGKCSNWLNPFLLCSLSLDLSTQKRLMRLSGVTALSILLITSHIACKKFLDIEPPKTELVTESVFDNSSTATAALVAIYGGMINDIFTYDFSLSSGLYSDELFNYSLGGGEIAYYTNNLDPVTNVPSKFWSNPYNYIYQANAVWEGCSNSTILHTAIKKQLMAEAKFIRAFWYFYLVNLYGEVPLITSTNYEVNSQLGRSPIEQVYNQIIADLKEAKENLNSNYVDNSDTTITTERIRPNKYVAAALLARVYLFRQRYQDAEEQATYVINNTALYDTAGLNDVFLKNSKEAIWQIPASSSTINYDTWEGQNYILISVPTNCTISIPLLNAFEIGDRRKLEWIGTFTDNSVNPSKNYLFPFKYKVKNTISAVREYTMILRMAEQYLIRAEARAQQDKIAEAEEDLNVIRHRAGLSNTTAHTKEALLTAILHERQVELFTEWGHRWLDIKRTNEVNRVMQQIVALKGGIWANYKQYWPIPQTDIANNPRLKQTDGYN